MPDEYIPRKATLEVIYTSTAPALEVKAMPAADVMEVIHAHWIDENPEDLLDVRMRCSNCLTVSAPYAHWHYCPSCGATMDETTEEREITHEI